jgi:3-oxoadipate enol-lactonase
MMKKRLLAIGDGCRLAWRFEGPVDAPVLLLSNSLSTTMEMWAPQIAMWARRFNVLRYDSRGHGDSDAPAGAYSMDRLGRDAVELLDRWIHRFDALQTVHDATQTQRHPAPPHA